MVGGRGRSRTGRTAALGRNAPSPYQFLGEAGKNGSPLTGRHMVGSCLTVGGRIGSPHSREAEQSSDRREEALEEALVKTALKAGTVVSFTL